VGAWCPSSKRGKVGQLGLPALGLETNRQFARVSQRPISARSKHRSATTPRDKWTEESGKRRMLCSNTALAAEAIADFLGEVRKRVRSSKVTASALLYFNTFASVGERPNMIVHSDFSVVVKLGAPAPKSWRWEIYRAGRNSPIERSKRLFDSVTEASRAGKRTLALLLAEFPD